MGFFSKLFGGGGGGSTVVNQTSANKTDVKVTSQIANLIDLSVLAEAVKATGKQTQDLIASLSKAQIMTQIADIQQRAAQSEMIKTALKFTGFGLVAYLIWREFYG